MKCGSAVEGLKTPLDDGIFALKFGGIGVQFCLIESQPDSITWSLGNWCSPDEQA